MWNRIVIEIVQAQPSEFEAGYSSARVWINDVVSSKVYFDNYTSNNYLFPDMNNLEVMLCSNTAYGTNNLEFFGDYDMINLVWFRGAEGLYSPTVTQGKFYSTLSILSYRNFTLLMYRSDLCTFWIYKSYGNNVFSMQIWLLYGRKPMPE